VVPAARRFGLGVLPFYPLANGLLTGKFRRGQEPPPGSRLADRPDYITADKLDRVETLIEWAAERGRTILEVAVGGLAAQDGCASVIAGATTPEQVKANAAASDWIPTTDDLAGLDRVLPPPGGPR
jgi:aryl-alcohol dehydrogenase-like predicted oxidoreductase